MIFTDRFLKEKNEKVIRLMKNEFVGLRTKTYSYLKENNHENKKAKGTKSVS